MMAALRSVGEVSLGAEHPDVARDLNNLALLLQDTNRLAEAEPLLRRNVEILLRFTQDTGHRHPHLETGLGNYRRLLTAMDLPEEEVRFRLAALGLSPDPP